MSFSSLLVRVARRKRVVANCAKDPLEGGWAGEPLAGDKGRVQWIFLLLAAATVLNAQAGFRTEGRLVLVNAGVYDGRNRFHGELSKEHFRLMDEGVEMRVESVGIEEVPVSTVILL